MIEFIKPSFNTFTLNFPPLTEAEKQKALADAKHDVAVTAMVELLTLQKSVARKVRRNQQRKMLNWLVFRPGFVTPPPNHREQNLTSTRGQRRRIQLGHEKPVDQSAVEVFGGQQ